MKQEPTEKNLVDFSLPETISDPVIVRLRGSEVIGRVYQDSGDGEGPIIYTTISKEGSELCPPTDDWGVVENTFQKYVSQLTEKNSAEERDKFWMQLADRYQELENIRQGKRRNHTQEITI